MKSATLPHPASPDPVNVQAKANLERLIATMDEQNTLIGMTTLSDDTYRVTVIVEKLKE